MNSESGTHRFPFNQWLASYAASTVMLGPNLDLVWFNEPVRTKNWSIEELAIETILVILGAIIGAITADIFGRRTTLLVTSIFAIPRIAQTYLTTAEEEWMNWFFISFGSGITCVVVPLYISEIAGTNNRGNLMVMPESVYFLGNLASGIVLAVSSAFDDQYVVIFMHRALLAVSISFHAMMLWAYPETPHYLNWEKRHQATAKALAVFGGIESIESRQGSTKPSINARVEKQQGRGIIREILQIGNQRSLLIIFSLIAIRRASGEGRNSLVLWNIWSEYQGFEANFIPPVTIFAATLIFSVFIMFTIHMFEEKIFLLQAILMSLITAIIGTLDFVQYDSILIGVLFVQYLIHLILIAVTFAYVGKFFLINVRAIVIALVISWEVLMRNMFFLIDTTFVIPSIREGEYTTEHSYANCGTLLIGFFFVLIIFPKTNKVPCSQITMEISVKGECVLVEKTVLL